MKVIMNEVSAEVRRARVLHPSPDLLVTAFAEEAGEVIKAVLDYKAGKGPFRDVKKEIIQTMAMCVRLLDEGDPIHALPQYEAIAIVELP
jgi:NTP pyrophosphatase (non-canonical NTP hydrolase)